MEGSSASATETRAHTGPNVDLTGHYERRLFNGKCQVIIQARREAGQLTLIGTSDGLSPFNSGRQDDPPSDPSGLVLKTLTREPEQHR